MMSRYRSILLSSAVFCGLFVFSEPTSAVPITGQVEATSPLGQDLALSMMITDTTTTFELTGPDYSYFAFGFDTSTMMGYSLIVEGLNDNRTAVEQNLLGIGNPGVPQANQDINIVSTVHHDADDLTTIVIERANQTGDAEDPDFSTSMTALDVIWGYNSFATPQSPLPDLSYHGSNGRGFTTIEFSPIPEPTSSAMVLTGVMGTLTLFRRRRRC